MKKILCRIFFVLNVEKCRKQSYESWQKPLKILDFEKIVWYFINIRKRKIKKGVMVMLNEEICKLRDKLNKSIENGDDYSITYNLSVELDELIAQFYRIEKDTDKKLAIESI